MEEKDNLVKCRQCLNIDPINEEDVNSTFSSEWFTTCRFNSLRLEKHHITVKCMNYIRPKYICKKIMLLIRKKMR